MVVWDKQTAVLGQCYLQRHELVGVWARLPRQTAVGDQFHRKLAKGRQRRVTRPNVIPCARVSGAEREHNAQKPLALIVDLVRDGSDPGEVVLDPFCGFGTTLIACETTGRRGRAVELKPREADKAIMRWVRFTAREAKRVSDDVVFPAGG